MSNRINLFNKDLEDLNKKLVDGEDIETSKKLDSLKDKLILLHEKNLVKINHSVMELVAAKYLILNGYDVDVEHELENGLICDIFGSKGFGSLILEIETGFIPPEYALHPLTYSRARIMSKVIRYSTSPNKFALGTPPQYIMQVPSIFFTPPRERNFEELHKIKRICDVFYKNPPVNINDIQKAKLHTIYIVDVDNVVIKETDPINYMDLCLFWENKSVV